MDTKFTIECSWHLLHLRRDNSIQAAIFVSIHTYIWTFFIERYWLKICVKYNFLNRSIENRDPLHWRSARRKTNSISDNAIQKFLITRIISLKKNWIQLQVKKKPLKKAFIESKTVMLINSVLMTTLIPLYVKTGTFTACSGCAYVTFWKLKKFWYFTDNHITVILTIYRKCYDIKRNIGIVYFFSTSSFVSNFVFSERYLLVLILKRAIIIYSTLSSSVTCSSRASAA